MTGAKDLKIQSNLGQKEAITRPLSEFTLLCDFDGPIVDVSDRYYSTYQLGLADIQAIYQQKGVTLPLQILTKKQFWQIKQDHTPDAEIALRSGLQSEQIPLFLKRVHQIVNQPALLQKDQLQPGVRWALALLHSQGIRLAVVTLRCQAQVVKILQDYGLAHLFTLIRGMPDEQAAYQNYTELKKQLLAEILAEESFRSTSQQPGCAWIVGDTEADILAGQAIGISTIGVTCGIRSASYLNQLKPTRLSSDLLAAAHYLLGMMQLVQV
jgi:phosphoglycolate phosphatase-like HAD superfamily hydrolase